jgi:DNA replication licensing factor MCM7
MDEHMPHPTVNFKEEDLSTFDLLMDQRKFNMQQQLNIAM